MNQSTEPQSHENRGGLGLIVRRIFKAIVLVLLLVICALFARTLYAFRDRSPGYQIQLDFKAPAAPPQPAVLHAGFGRTKINPDMSDPARPVWIAGFDQHRAATSIHDDLWAIACVLDDGVHRIGLVALDAIGLFNDDVIAIRRQVPSDCRLDYTVVCATHNHSTPDLMGLWGPNLWHTGVDPQYRAQVISAAVGSLKAAVASLEPALIRAVQIAGPTNVLADTRLPKVLDPDIRVVHLLSQRTGATLGTVVGWADHPETVWGRNTEITADFCGYLRNALENGVYVGDRRVAAGLGGIHLYFNGAVGGLMTTHPTTKVTDPYTGQEYQQPTHDKARALGHVLAAAILPELAQTNLASMPSASLEVHARTIRIKLDNPAFMLAPILGLMDRGHTGWMHLRSEVAVITLGDTSIACVPGEIYPEIVNGGIERAPGGDFDVEPVEVPSLRAMMPGKVKFVFGLANDEIGYIIPKTEWDHRAPYLYGAKHAPYGEINSVGPDTAPTIHHALSELFTLAKPSN